MGVQTSPAAVGRFCRKGREPKARAPDPSPPQPSEPTVPAEAPPSEVVTPLETPVASMRELRTSPPIAAQSTSARRIAPRTGTLALLAGLMLAVALGAPFALHGAVGWLIGSAAFLVLAWNAYGASGAWRNSRRSVVLRLWGLEWTRDEACTHFLITGATGTGKTSRAIVPIVHGLRQARRDTGVLAIDSKGALWEPMVRVAAALGQEAELRLIQVRAPGERASERPTALRLNLIGDRSVPWATYAKLLVDTATAAGQKGGQAFFKETARDLITHAMQALEACGLPVTLENVRHVCCDSSGTEELAVELEKSASEAGMAERMYFRDFAAQPPEQRSGTVWTAANYLRPYTSVEFAEAFCAVEPNFSVAEVDQGRIVCLSIPQAFQTERKYLNLFMKQLFLLHAFRRFDLSDEERRRRNMLVLVLDEAQKTTLVSEDGFSDFSTADELREAGVCLVVATQTPLSFYASFGEEKKADVFMANLRTQVHFRAADEKGAKIISQKLGGRPVRKYSGGVSGGKTSRNWQIADEPWVKPEEMLALQDGTAVLRHPTRSGSPLRQRLSVTAFTRPNDKRGN